MDADAGGKRRRISLFRPTSVALDRAGRTAPCPLGWGVKRGSNYYTDCPREGLCPMLWPYRLQSTPQPTTTRPPGRLAALYGLYGRPRFSPQRVLTRGGRLIVWHGLADQEISPRSTLAWWGGVAARPGRGAGERGCTALPDPGPRPLPGKRGPLHPQVDGLTAAVDRRGSDSWPNRRTRDRCRAPHHRQGHTHHHAEGAGLQPGRGARRSEEDYRGGAEWPNC